MTDLDAFHRLVGRLRGQGLDEDQAHARAEEIMEETIVTEVPMRHFICGIVLGSLLTGTVVGATSSYYDKSGTPNAPTGSIQSFDYYRQRQLFLDAAAIRRAQDQNRWFNNPCGK